MFESLKDGLQSAFKSLRGKGKLTEANMRDGLALVEQSLLEADVSIGGPGLHGRGDASRPWARKSCSRWIRASRWSALSSGNWSHLLGPVDSSLHLRSGLERV